MFNYVRLSDGGPKRLPGPRSEVHVIAQIAKLTLGKSEAIDWEQMEQTNTIRHWISKVVPGYEAIDKIADTKREFQVGGRTYHKAKFNTPDGRAQLVVHELPEITPLAANQLRLRFVSAPRATRRDLDASGRFASHGARARPIGHGIEFHWIDASDFGQGISRDPLGECDDVLSRVERIGASGG
jgi:hypothetical protein